MQYTLSKHNIISKIKDSSDWYIVNLLSGQADILTDEVAQQLLSGTYPDEQELIEKGYLSESKREESLFRSKYFQFIEERDQDEIQLFFVPNYACNFACTYCYQDEYSNVKETLTKEIIDSFFDYIRNTFENRKKYITIFGGEPLLNSPKQKELISYFIIKAKMYNLTLAIVTNGYHLLDYMDILKNAPIREIQVTLDGTGPVHDARRFLKGGGETFNRIAQGVDTLLEFNIPVNLRMVVDKENIASLPDLAQFAIDRGWTKHPQFKTQLGRNYELHHCHENSKRLFSRISLYETLYTMIKEHPHITEFHKPAFSIARFLSENGELPQPLFDSCPGTKTEWAFDYTGKIYSCTATVGKTGEELGTFFPTVSLDNTIVSEWGDRDVTSINKCSTCNLQLACGGGCASVAKNRTGVVKSEDCRPVKELLELGMGYYF